MGAWEITIKDLRLILKDRGALYTLLALPVVFIAILGVSTGQLITTHEASKLLKVGLVDQVNSELSEHVFNDLSSIGGLKVDKIPNRDEALLRLQDGRSSVVVILGKNFDERVAELDLGDVFDTNRGKLSKGLSAVDMQVESGTAFVGVADLVQYVVLSAVLRVVAPEVARRNMVLSRIMDRIIERHLEEAASDEAVESTAPTPVKPGPSIIYQTLVPAFMVMFAFFLVNIMASSFINERKLGTLRRLQASRITSVQLLWGKTLPFLLVSVGQSLLLFLSGKFLFGMDRIIERHLEEAASDEAVESTAPTPVKPGPSIIYQTLVPAFMVMFAFFLVNIMASSFINERKLGTLRRLQASRITSVQLLWGKTLPFLLVSVGQSLLLFLSGKFLFGMSWGTYPLMLLPVVLTTSISATGLGLLLATIVRTESQVSSYSTFLVIVLAGISGCYMPRDWLPELMKNVSLATPHAWALIAYQELLTHDHPNMITVGQCCSVMALFGSLCFAIGCWRFRRLEYPR